MSRMTQRRNLYFAVAETLNVLAGVAAACLFMYIYNLDLPPLVFVLAVAICLVLSLALYQYVVLDLIFNWADRKSRQES